MFDIQFTAMEPEPQDGGWDGLWGRITLGEYQESFIAPLGLWQRADYERHWLEAAERLLHGHNRTAFFTEAGRFWWTAWREEDTIFIHEEFITPERAERMTDLQAVSYELIDERSVVTKEGEPISEWRVRMDDVRDFVERRTGAYRPVLYLPNALS